MKEKDILVEFQEIIAKVKERTFLDEIERLMDLKKVKVFNHGRYIYYEYDIQQNMISMSRRKLNRKYQEMFESAGYELSEKPGFIFNGKLIWKEYNGANVQKSVVIFNNISSTVSSYDYLNCIEEYKDTV